MTSIPAPFIWEYSHPRGSMAKWLMPGAGFQLCRPDYKSCSGHKQELFLVAIQPRSPPQDGNFHMVAYFFMHKPEW